MIQGGSRMSEGKFEEGEERWKEIEEKLKAEGFKDQREVGEGLGKWEEGGERIVERETCE